MHASADQKTQNTAAPSGPTVDPQDVAGFNKLSHTWWDLEGPMAPLHALNPVRVKYIRDRLCDHFGREKNVAKPLEGLRLVDVGCGGGLLSEPLARMGATVVGLDAGSDNIAAAKAHAEKMGVPVDYRAITSDELALAEPESFDAVISMEVIEHVADLDVFTKSLSDLLKPGGALCIATLNRTAKSYALGIVAAEYILGWVPKGTHNWKQFLKPSEVQKLLHRYDIELEHLAGVSLDPVAGEWFESRDLSVNYMGYGRKA